MNTRENSEIPARAPELTRELTTDEIEVVSGGWFAFWPSGGSPTTPTPYEIDNTYPLGNWIGPA